MIWKTAKSTEVNRRHKPLPEPGGDVAGRTVGFGPPRRRPGSRWLEPLDGAERRDRSAAGRARRPPRAAAKSAWRSSRSSSPTETRSRPGVIPAASSSASVDWRCDVDGGWTTIVWTLPSDAVSSGRRSASMIAPSGRAAPVDLEGEHPAGHARPELAQGDVVLGMAGETRDRGRRARHPDARASAASAAAVAAWRSTRMARVRIPRRTRNASSGPSVAPGIDLDAFDVGDQLRRTRRRPRR